MTKELKNEKEIYNLDIACSMLRENFWTDKNVKGTPVMQYFSPKLFLDKENVRRMAAAVAVNLRNGYDGIDANDNATTEDIIEYEKEVKLIKTQFKRAVDYQLAKAYELDPEEAEKAKLKNGIKESINDFSKGNI